ncbi:hypothetical protein EXE59_09235 [Nocardioides eburneiflavus]|uniref:WD40 repeat domain-containing protein n=1 Tax=Nocardioides eburneiflavus TaxID=2518372 RepID=A0A4Z1BRY1_9ACTN|nr:hypothetical protein [Nocardioides eburneiflavus]TGN64111.1 hypothetical protein EXE59_09235 [Nocardioides eburneiflavus]
MSTDLRTALREAVADAPAYDVDPDDVIRAGGRRRRRHAGAVVGVSALAAAAVVVTVVLAGHERPDPAPAPAEIVRLDLEDSAAVDLDVVASTRTSWDNDRDSLAYDRLAGITADGLVLHTRYTDDRGHVEVGLLDPATGVTDWLPPLPGRPPEVTPVELGEGRLVLAEWMHQGRTFHLYDRGTRTWQSSVVHVSGAWERHVPPLVRMGPDDRVYVGSTMEGESAPLHWWSAPLDEGGRARVEEGLEGVAVAWAGGAVVRAAADGRVVVVAPDGETELSDRRPDGCNAPASFPEAAPTVLWAGDSPVVTYLCDSGSDVPGSTTVVHDRQGGRAVEVADATVVAADDSHVVLAGPSDGVDHPGVSSTYVLDLTELTVARIGGGLHDTQAALAAGLLLWNTPGPRDSQDAYDVVWKVARLG